MFKPSRIVSALALVIGISGLSACNNATTESSSLNGSAFKGPIDNALIQVTDTTGTLLASGSSHAGIFNIDDFDIPAGAIFISTQNGSYTDEATGNTVDLSGAGLMTVFTDAELRSLIDNNQYIAMTPETTLMAKLVKEMLANGDTVETAITAAKALIKKELIDGTNPAGIPGDDILTSGNLSSAIPADEKEALARNRAISYSYQAKNLNLNPQQVFDMIEQQVKVLIPALWIRIAHRINRLKQQHWQIWRQRICLNLKTCRYSPIRMVTRMMPRPPIHSSQQIMSMSQLMRQATVGIPPCYVITACSYRL